MTISESDSSRVYLCQNYDTATSTGIYLPGSWIRGFDAANAASEYSDGIPNRDKMGAAIFCSGRLLSIGYNLYKKTTPKSIIMKRGHEIVLSLHAEQSALTKIRYRDYEKNKLIMYIYRKNTHNMPVNSKPCNKCQELLHASGIKIARYINGNGLATEMRFY